MKLHQVSFTHYSQKDSETGILSWVVAEEDEQVLQFLIGDDHLYGWSGWERDGDEGEVGPVNDWWDENPGEVARAESLGLTVHLCDWGDREGKPDWVSGPLTQVIRWWRGDPREVSNLYYGATQVHWDAGKEISIEEAEVLIRLGVATDLRQPV